MGRLTAISPVSWSDLLDFAGGRPLIRKAFVAMASRGQSAGFRDDAGFYVVAFLVPVGDSLEFCLAIEPRARARMRELVRLAHLTFSALAETDRAIHAHVVPGNRSGERMAAMAGFVKDETDLTLWHFRGRNGKHRERPVRRGRQRREGSGGEEPSVAASGQ